VTQYTPHDICAWAGRQTVGGAKRKAVLNALALFADRMTWECWPSFALLAQYTEIAERTVSRAVAELERDGFLSRERIRRRDGSLGGWRFRLNPKGVETVIPGRPGAAAGEDESTPDGEPTGAADDADFPDASGLEPPANLAGGDQPLGERPGNGTLNVDLNNPPTGPGGETTTVVKLASPPATGGGSIELPLGTTTSPLPPSPQAAALPAGEAGGGLGLGDQSPDPFTRYRAALRQTFGESAFAAWLADLEFDGPPAPDAAGRPRLVASTSSAVRADRIGQQFARSMGEIWERVIGPPGAPPRVVVRIDQARAAEARKKAEDALRAKLAAPEGGGADDQASPAPRQNRKGRRFG
jgi:hypothetical protein